MARLQRLCVIVGALDVFYRVVLREPLRELLGVSHASR